MFIAVSNIKQYLLCFSLTYISLSLNLFKLPTQIMKSTHNRSMSFESGIMIDFFNRNLFAIEVPSQLEDPDLRVVQGQRQKLSGRAESDAGDVAQVFGQTDAFSDIDNFEMTCNDKTSPIC